MIVFAHGGVSGTAKPRYDLTPAIAAASLKRTALDAVEACIRELEDDERLNAGFGAVLTIDGVIELDAGIADGRRGAFGSVIGVSVDHPITLARRVLEETPHAILAGAGAVELGRDMQRVAVSPEQRAIWERSLADGSLSPERFGSDEHVDTVGTVALDHDGHLAAGSSTGGVRGKLRGRVGDSPVFGAGFYASSTAAVVGTGVGERFLETLACARVADLIAENVAPQQACEDVIDRVGHRSDEPVGLLAIDRDGEVGAAFRGASWSVWGPDGYVEAASRP
ncbi:MAG TPA: isoaspartyl peptidase/L-asparaginase [Actinomycetota bacterium]|nr:isoaspartyl peptidase/L-asparaginase [Actinomycetota bacterium]